MRAFIKICIQKTNEVIMQKEFRIRPEFFYFIVMWLNNRLSFMTYIVTEKGCILILLYDKIAVVEVNCDEKNHF